MSKNSLEVNLQNEGQKLLRQVIRAYYPIEYSVLVSGFYRCLARLQQQTATTKVSGITSKDLAHELKLTDHQVQTMLGFLTKELLIYQIQEEIRDQTNPPAKNYRGHHHSQRPIIISKYTVQYEHVVNIVRYKHHEIVSKYEKKKEGEQYQCATEGCSKSEEILSLTSAYSGCLVYVRTHPGTALNPGKALFCTECTYPLKNNNETYDKIAAKIRFNTQISEIVKQTDIVFKILRDLEEIRKSGVLQSGILASTSGPVEAKAAPGGRGGFSSAQELANRVEVKKQRIEWDKNDPETLNNDQHEYERHITLQQQLEREEKEKREAETAKYIQEQAEEARQKLIQKNVIESLFHSNSNNSNLISSTDPRGALQAELNQAADTMVNTLATDSSAAVKIEQEMQKLEYDYINDPQGSGIVKTEAEAGDVGQYQDNNGFYSAEQYGIDQDNFIYSSSSYDDEADQDQYDHIDETKIESGADIEDTTVQAMKRDYTTMESSTAVDGQDSVQFDTNVGGNVSNVPSPQQEIMVSVNGSLYALSQLTEELLDVMTDAEYEEYAKLAQTITST